METNVINGHFKQLLDCHIFIFIIKMVEDNADANLTTKKCFKMCNSFKNFYLEC